MNSISISWDYDNNMNKDAFKVAVVVRFQRGMNACTEYLSNMTSCDSPFEIFSSMLVVQSLSHIRCFATPGGAAPLSVGFPRQEYWRGIPFPSAGDLPDSGIEFASPALAGDKEIHFQSSPKVSSTKYEAE